MSTFRTGTHWQVTLVRSPSGSEERAEGDVLVAVVMNGTVVTPDVELAERVAELLNAPTPDVPYTHGAREALAEVRRRLDVAAGPGERLFTETIHAMIGVVADELGVVEEGEVRPSPAPRPPAPRPLIVADSCTSADTCTRCTAGRGHVPADSCTCVYRPGGGADPNCVVHQGRRAKGPKPSNLPGCICDGSGRTCPRHGAVT